MAVVSIIPATTDHIEQMRDMVRPEDRDELWASCMRTPEETMKSAIEYSEIAQTGCIDGIPVMMWGVVRESLICDVGVPWMVGTTLLDRHAVTFLRRCKRPVLELFKDYDMLTNYVDVRNVRAIAWLRWLGFKIADEPEPYGLMRLPFLRFTMGV